jgi:antitoxin CptB
MSSMLSDSEIKRAYWASRRGMLELDLLLVPFVERRLRALSGADQQRYVRLLECEDTELFSWFLQRQRPEDGDLAGIVEQILEFARTTAH